MSRADEQFYLCAQDFQWHTRGPAVADFLKQALAAQMASSMLTVAINTRLKMLTIGLWTLTSTQLASPIKS